MQFRGPFDPNTGLPSGVETPWQNASPSFGVPGSIPPAEVYDEPQREICHVIDRYLGDGSFGSGQDPSDLTQLYKALQAVEANAKATFLAEMDFNALVDPDDPSPDNVNRGTFNTIRDLINAAPEGSSVTCRLQPGKTYPLDLASINILNRSVRVIKAEDGLNPTIAPVAYFDVGNDLNRFYFFAMRSGAISFQGVNFVFPVKPDPTKDWARLSLIEYTGEFTRASFLDGSFTGQDGQSIVSSHFGTIAQLSMKDVTLNGAVHAVSNAASGAAIVTQYSTTLLNGATLFDGGVRGENLLHN